MLLQKCRLPLILLCAVHFGRAEDFKCPKGQRITSDGPERCEKCPDNHYQPTENDKQSCLSCTKCKSGSEEIVRCLPISNTKCRCRIGFVSREPNSALCKCDIGSGLKGGECYECDDGYFTSRMNSECTKWKNCKGRGVKVNGSKSTDVICNEGLDEGTPTNTTAEPKRSPTGSTLYTHRSQKVNSTTRGLPRRGTTSPNSVLEVTTDNRGRPINSRTDKIGMSVLLTVGIIGLFISTALTCKLIIVPCLKSYHNSTTKDSEYRRPVEESGDSRLSS